MTLLSVEEARARVLSKFQPVASETSSLTKSAARILAMDIVAADDLPPFDNSSMDGFAIRAADSSNAAPASPLTLRVVADIPAGSTPKVSLAAGEAARIMTGAQMPVGANAVVPVEDTDFNNRDAGSSAPSRVQIAKQINSGENVRPRGMDVKKAISYFIRVSASLPKLQASLPCLVLRTLRFINDRAWHCYLQAMNYLK